MNDASKDTGINAGLPPARSVGSASIDCPKCGGRHPTGVKVCGCGHDLSMMDSNLAAAPANDTPGVAKSLTQHQSHQIRFWAALA